MKGLFSLVLLLCISVSVSAQSLKKVKKKGYWGMKNSIGWKVIPCEYDDLKTFSYGLIAALKDDKWGFINKKNETVIPFQFDEVENFKASAAIVTVDKKKGLINLKGELILPIDYEKLSISKEYVIYKKKGIAGLTDTLGQKVSPVYQDINSFNRGKISIKKDGKWGSWKDGVENMNDDYLLFSDFDFIGIFSVDCTKGYKKDIALMLDTENPSDIPENKAKVIKSCSESELLSYIYNQIQYPVAARKAGIEGLVIVNFILEKDGSIADANIIRDIGGGCGEEVLRIMKAMPKWHQASIKGNKLINSSYNIPVRFKIQN